MTEPLPHQPPDCRAPILLLGLGNILLGDEGVGVRVVEALAERYEVGADVEVLDGGTSGMDLLDTIAGRSALIVIDALKSLRRPPGEVVRLEGEAIDQLFRTRLSPHQLGLSEVLASLVLTDQEPAVVVIIGVVPQSLDLSLQLSAVGSAALEGALDMLVTELGRLGVPFRPRVPAVSLAVQ